MRVHRNFSERYQNIKQLNLLRFRGKVERSKKATGHINIIVLNDIRIAKQHYNSSWHNTLTEDNYTIAWKQNDNYD